MSQRHHAGTLSGRSHPATGCSADEAFHWQDNRAVRLTCLFVPVVGTMQKPPGLTQGRVDTCCGKFSGDGGRQAFDELRFGEMLFTRLTKGVVDLPVGCR